MILLQELIQLKKI